MKPYYEETGITIYHADCSEVLPALPRAAAIVSDPPYGMNNNCDYTRFTVGAGGHGAASLRKYAPIHGDNKNFDPSPWLPYEEVILFGFNHFASRLPVGTTLVWLKRFDPAFGSFLSDAELAWMKGGHGVYCFRDLSLMGETNARCHPTQKPVPLMQWCIQKVSGDLIIDPYMGSGTTLVAAKNLGRKSVGIEIEEKYCEIAANRLRQSVLNFEAVG